MKLRLIITLSLLGLVSSSPYHDKRELIVNGEFFLEDLVVYQSEHDIVNLVVPLNSLNFEEEESSESSESNESDYNSRKSISNISVFFAEADIDNLGKRTYKGLYVLKNKQVSKILENGVDAAASADGSKTVYLAATDGIYIYSPEHQTPVKYGSISDNVIGIAHEAESEVFYILTADHSVYKVLDNGNKKEKLEDVINAQQIVVDYSNNLYFYTPDNKLYVKNSEGVKEVDGLSENPSKCTLVKPPRIFDDGVIWIADGNVYQIHASGISKKPGIKFEAMPTSFGSEALLATYYGYKKKIYEFDIQSMTTRQIEELEYHLGFNPNDFQNWLSQKKQTKRA